MPFLVDGGDVLAGGFVEAGFPWIAHNGRRCAKAKTLCALVTAAAIFLELAQGGGVLLALAAEAALLDRKIVELALVGEEDFGLDQVLAGVGLLGGELVCEFEAADGVDAEFEGRDAEQTPLGVGEGLDEIALLVAGGLMAREEGGDVSFVERGIVTGKQDSTAGETGFDGIER